MAPTFASHWDSLVRYITIIDLRQLPHHRHHVTHNAEWGGGANENAVHPKVEPAVRFGQRDLFDLRKARSALLSDHS